VWKRLGEGYLLLSGESVLIPGTIPITFVLKFL
jgi:hypothetical protein